VTADVDSLDRRPGARGFLEEAVIDVPTELAQEESHGGFEGGRQPGLRRPEHGHLTTLPVVDVDRIRLADGGIGRRTNVETAAGIQRLRIGRVEELTETHRPTDYVRRGRRRRCGRGR
jgi:hypothetical protein